MSGQESGILGILPPRLGTALVCHLGVYVQCINLIGHIQTRPTWRGRLEKQRKRVRRIKEQRGLLSECGNKSQPVFR